MNGADVAGMRSRLYFERSLARLLCQAQATELHLWSLSACPSGRPTMIFRAKLLYVVAVSGFAGFVAMAPAQALTMQECSAKYKQAKDAGTLGGQKWNDFRKAQCGADATDRKSTRLNSSHMSISYAVFCLKKKKK